MKIDDDFGAAPIVRDEAVPGTGPGREVTQWHGGVGAGLPALQLHERAPERVGMQFAVVEVRHDDDADEATQGRIVALGEVRRHDGRAGQDRREAVGVALRGGVVVRADPAREAFALRRGVHDGVERLGQVALHEVLHPHGEEPCARTASRHRGQAATCAIEQRTSGHRMRHASSHAAHAATAVEALLAKGMVIGLDLRETIQFPAVAAMVWIDHAHLAHGARQPVACKPLVGPRGADRGMHRGRPGIPGAQLGFRRHHAPCA